MYACVHALCIYTSHLFFIFFRQHLLFFEKHLFFFRNELKIVSYLNKENVNKDCCLKMYHFMKLIPQMILVSFFNTSHNVICFSSKYKKCKNIKKSDLLS